MGLPIEKAPTDAEETTDGANPDHMIVRHVLFFPFFFFLTYFVAIFMYSFICSLTQGLQPAAIEQPSTISHPLIQEEYANSTMRDFQIYGSSSTMDACYIHGGYTGLLLGVDEAATRYPTARKLQFSGV